MRARDLSPAALSIHALPMPSLFFSSWHRLRQPSQILNSISQSNGNAHREKCREKSRRAKEKETCFCLHAAFYLPLKATLMARFVRETYIIYSNLLPITGCLRESLVRSF